MNKFFEHQEILKKMIEETSVTSVFLALVDLKRDEVFSCIDVYIPFNIDGTVERLIEDNEPS